MQIQEAGGRILSYSLNSRNGTSIKIGQNFKRDEEYYLRDQDQIDFAQTQV